MMYFEEIFINSLWSRLKDRVQGSVFCKIENDTLIVRIKHNGLCYEDTVRNIAWKIADGELNSKDHAEWIVRDYTQQIIKITLKEYIR